MQHDGRRPAGHPARLPARRRAGSGWRPTDDGKQEKAGCGPSALDRAKGQEVKTYLLEVVGAERRYHKMNETYSLNMKELISIDDSLEKAPAGYTVDGGGGLALAFGYEVRATPTGSGSSFYVNQSGVVRFSSWGSADEGSDPVE